MGFKNVTGVEIRAQGANEIFLVADYFTVYKSGEQIPTIYSWEEIKGISESKYSFVISMGGLKSYVLKKEWFSDTDEILRCRAIMESYAQGAYLYDRSNRLLPKKDIYRDVDVPNRLVSTMCKYDPDDLLEASHAQQSNLYLRHTWILTFAIWCAAVLIFSEVVAMKLGWVATLGLFLLGSIIISLIFFFIARCIQTSLVGRIMRNDEAMDYDVIFVVCSEGVAAIEKNVGFYSELIPWSYFTGYIETQTMLVFTRRGRAVVRLPFRAISRDQEAWIRKLLISIGVPEKGR